MRVWTAAKALEPRLSPGPGPSCPPPPPGPAQPLGRRTEFGGSFFILCVRAVMSLLVSPLPQMMGNVGQRGSALFAALQHP